MIYFKNWELTADCEVIARQHDNLTRSITVTGDLPPDWTWEMYVSAGGNMDILPMKQDESGISVLLTAQNLPVAGEYAFELHGKRGEKTRSTNRIHVYIPPTMSGDAHWPEIPTAFTDLEKRMQALANTYPTIGDNGNWFISGKDTGVLAKGLTPFIGSNGNWWVGNEDTGVLADPAELSKLTQQAQAAQTAAQTSAEAASQSAAEAAGSATAAQSAQTAAEAAQTKADADATATAEARKIVESAADAETARVEAEKARAAKDAERDGKISAIADGLQTTQQTVAALADRLDVLDVLFKFPRTGKVYTVKIPKFAANPTTVCEKQDDNVGLVCEPSTDTVEGRDDYAEIPLFRWYNCNYLRDSHGHAYPTAIEGISEDYVTTGSVDVGVIQMAPYIKWEDADGYNILSITDTPREGYQLWCEAASDGKDYPYVIHSKYFSGIAEDGLPRSQPNLKPERNNSYQNLISKYAQKGDGYFGAREARNTWQIIFTMIKYATKSSQAVFAGCTSYNYRHAASIQREDKLTYFPLTNAQAANILVGSYVSVGYGSNNNGAINNDRSLATIHKYADSVRVLRIETLDDTNSAVYLDIEDGFDTMPVKLTDALSAPITLTTMHWWSGSTDAVIGHHDGSLTSNTDGKHPYRVQGIEYAVGGYSLASDVIIDIQSDCGKNVLVAPPEAKRLTDAAQAVQNYRLIGNASGNAGADYWIGGIALDLDSGVSYPCAIGSGDRTGVGDGVFSGGTATAGQREYLRCGHLGVGSYAGSSCLHCGNWLAGAGWHYLAAD